MTDYPVDSYREAAPLLRRPFTPAAVKFKMQTTWPKEQPTGGLVVAYIDARLAVERLNQIVPHLWFDEYESAGHGLMLCKLTVDGLTRKDVGEGEGKGLYSDALKRAAVKFGIGVSLYAIPKMIVDVNKGHAKVRRTNKGPTLELTPAGESHVRSLYTRWLDTIGTRAFGDPLDHGDSDNAQGDAEVEAVATPEVSPPPPPPQPVADTGVLEGIRAGIKGLGWKVGDVRLHLTAVGVQDVSDVKKAVDGLTPGQAEEMWSRIETAVQEPRAA